MKTKRIFISQAKPSKYKKLFAVLFVIMPLAGTQAQGPVQPEAMQFEPVDVTDVVNLATGDFVYTIPLMEVPGPEGGYPIVLSYHSGIGSNQPATWVGLGWTLNPGAINRTLNGFPDDYNGEVVKTVYESKGKKHHGVSLSGGWGPVGLNLSYNTSSGFGANFLVQASNGNFGVNSSLGTGGASFGIGYQQGPASLEVGISAGDQGITPSISANITNNGMRNPDNVTIGSTGSSISISKNSSNFSAAGVGFSTSGKPGEGYVSGFTIGIPIVFPNGLWFNIGYSQYQWNLYDVSVKNSFGALYQNDVNNERYKSGNYIYPSPDFFMVAAQGLTGTMSINYEEAFVLKDHYENDKQGYIRQDEGQYNFDPNVAPVFRFVGDAGNNFIPDYNNATWGENYNKINATRSTSKKVEPVLDGGTITGFSITDTDGIIYEFKKASYNYFQYSESIISGSPTLTNLNSLNGAFATTWFITAIKGPDYIDRGSSGFDNSDWGYWVEFEYETQANPQIWRAPFDGYQPGSDDNVTHFNLGLRDVSYLKSISTKTHTAVFDSDQVISLNNMSPGFMTNDKINPSTGASNVSGSHTFQFKGDFEWIDDPQNTDDVLKVYHVYADCDDVTGTQNCNYAGYYGSGTFYNLNDMTGPQHSNLTNKTSITVSVPGHLYDACHLISDPNYNGYCYAGTNAEIILNNVIQTGSTSSKVLSHIELYNKSDLLQEIKKISFDYDYHLRPKTNGSTASVLNGADNGSLTLNAIHLKGQNGQAISPPYRFEYANGSNPGSGLNPEFHKYDWDRWGSYRDPGANNSDRGYRKHNTPQDASRANQAASWSLTKITTPTGGEVEIEYESDDYYWVNNDAFDLLHGEEFTNKVTNTASFELTINPGYISTFSEKEALFLLEERTACQRYVEVHIGQNYYDPISDTWQVATSPIYGNEICDDHDKAIVYLIDEILPNNKLSLNGNPLSFKKSDTYYSYNPSQDWEYKDTYSYYWARGFNTYGGGIRVKTITTIDGSNILSTLYKYRVGEFSSGVVATLPGVTGDKHNFVSAPENYLFAFQDNERAYNRPPPGVLYSNVEVMNIDESGKPINGKTVFEFYTAKDFKYTAEVANNVLSIADKSAIYGKPKSHTYFEQVEDQGLILFRPLYKTEFEYAFSNDLNNVANVYFDDNDDWGVISNLSSKPLGAIQQKYVSHNEFTDGNWKTNEVDRITYNVFDVSQTNTKYFYNDNISLAYSSVLTTKARTIGLDMYTGQPLVTVSQSSTDNEVLINKTTPAWWKYPGMADKNMLTQGFENATFKAPFSIDQDANTDGILDVLGYDLENNNQDVIASTITTWDQWGTYNVWRKNDTYEFLPKHNYVPYPTGDLDYSSSNYVSATQAKPWEMTSNIVQYDNYGHVIESVNRDGTYQTVKYDPQNNSLVQAVVSNAKLTEVVYENFEEYPNYNPFTGGGVYDATVTGKSFAVPASPIFGGGYKVGVWVYGYPKVNGVVLPDATVGWKYYQTTVAAGGTVTLSTDDVALFDDLTIIPEYASISYFAYDPITWKVTAMTGPDHRTTFYEYDDAGRLILTRDFEGNIISKNEYGYGNDVMITMNPGVPEPGEAITFTVKNTKDSTPATMANYSWNFGDGAAASGLTTNVTTHTYNEAEAYRVILTTKDNKGNTRRIVEDIKIEPPIGITLYESQSCREFEEGEPVPVILDPPVSVLDILCDITVTTNVTGAVNPVSYRWFRKSNLQDDWESIPFETSNSIILIERAPSTIYLLLRLTDGVGRTEEKSISIDVGVQ